MNICALFSLIFDNLWGGGAEASGLQLVLLSGLLANVENNHQRLQN